MTHPCDIYRVSRSCGITLRDGKDHNPHSRKPMECYCKNTLRKIGRKHGEGHLMLVLKVISETKGNSGELYSETISAVSYLLAANPRIADQAGDLLTAFDAINLGALRRQAKAMSFQIPTSQVMATLLGMRFYDPLKKEVLQWVA